MNSDNKPSRVKAEEIERLLANPDTLKFFSVQWGISFEEATQRVRNIIEALERNGER